MTAITDMSVYNVSYYCNECGGWHATATRVQFANSELDGQSIVVAYLGRDLPSSIKVIQEPDKLHCPSINRPTSQPDPNKIFLILAT
ncbi:MAG: hypothetical protein QOG71_2239 [Pyrinomonadaceae bacterium]|nr:hypothetical protein [Pyrinomonadaceae bacterium]